MCDAGAGLPECQKDWFFSASSVNYSELHKKWITQSHLHLVLERTQGHACSFPTRCPNGHLLSWPASTPAHPVGGLLPVFLWKLVGCQAECLSQVLSQDPAGKRGSLCAAVIRWWVSRGCNGCPPCPLGRAQGTAEPREGPRAGAS